jgi:hypothetical protein
MKGHPLANTPRVSMQGSRSISLTRPACPFLGYQIYMALLVALLRDASSLDLSWHIRYDGSDTGILKALDMAKEQKKVVVGLCGQRAQAIAQGKKKMAAKLSEKIQTAFYDWLQKMRDAQHLVRIAKRWGDPTLVQETGADRSQLRLAHSSTNGRR